MDCDKDLDARICTVTWFAVSDWEKCFTRILREIRDGFSEVCIPTAKYERLCVCNSLFGHSMCYKRRFGDGTTMGKLSAPSALSLNPKAVQVLNEGASVAMCSASSTLIDIVIVMESSLQPCTSVTSDETFPLRRSSHTQPTKIVRGSTLYRYRGIQRYLATGAIITISPSWVLWR